MPLDNVVFWVFAPISVGSAIAMLFQRNAVHAALFLIVNFFTIAVFFLVLDAPFLFAVQIIVYAGAIMVLFLFVIILIGAEKMPYMEALRWQPSFRWKVLPLLGLMAFTSLWPRCSLTINNDTVY